MEAVSFGHIVFVRSVELLNQNKLLYDLYVATSQLSSQQPPFLWLTAAAFIWSESQVYIVTVQ